MQKLTYQEKNLKLQWTQEKYTVILTEITRHSEIKKQNDPLIALCELKEEELVKYGCPWRKY